MRPPPVVYMKLRLRIARLQAGYLKKEDAAQAIDASGAVKLRSGRTIIARTYKNYEDASGNAISPEIADQLENFFGTRRGWILHGKGESIEALRRMATELEKQAREQARKKRLPILSPSSENGSASDQVNQLTANIDNFAITPSQFVPVCRIPVLSGDDISTFCAGNREFPMNEQALVAVEDSTNLFLYILPQTDLSMDAGGALAFPPGTRCIIDTSAQIQPGCFVLVRFAGMDWTLREYRAALPFEFAKAFTLAAINPAFEPIRIENQGDVEIAGRLIETQISRKW